MVIDILPKIERTIARPTWQEVEMVPICPFPINLLAGDKGDVMDKVDSSAAECIWAWQSENRIRDLLASPRQEWLRLDKRIEVTACCTLAVYFFCWTFSIWAWCGNPNQSDICLQWPPFHVRFDSRE